MIRAVAIALKIPDNAAYTALVALRRLGVAVDHVERSEIYFFDDFEDENALRQRVTNDETIFNPNKHRMTVLEKNAPTEGEVWIVSESGASTIAWTLQTANGLPVSRVILDMAIERLLCNPAIDRAITSEKAHSTAEK
jgi:hypothetical protein